MSAEGIYKRHQSSLITSYLSHNLTSSRHPRSVTLKHNPDRQVFFSFERRWKKNHKYDPLFLGDFPSVFREQWRQTIETWPQCQLRRRRRRGQVRLSVRRNWLWHQWCRRRRAWLYVGRARVQKGGARVDRLSQLLNWPCLLHRTREVTKSFLSRAKPLLSILWNKANRHIINILNSKSCML